MNHREIYFTSWIQHRDLALSFMAAGKLKMRGKDAARGGERKRRRLTSRVHS
jgi:hypothetical protein